MPEPTMKNLSSARRATEKSPMTRPSSFSIGASVIRPIAGNLQARIVSSQAAAPAPLMVYFAKFEISDKPTESRTVATSFATGSKSVDRRQLKASSTPSGANQSAVSKP